MRARAIIFAYPENRDGSWSAYLYEFDAETREATMLENGSYGYAVVVARLHDAGYRDVVTPQVRVPVPSRRTPTPWTEYLKV